MPAFAAKHPGGVPEATTKPEGRAEPPKATPKPPQSHILGIDSGVQSHLKATPRLHQGSTKAPPRLHQSHPKATPMRPSSRLFSHLCVKPGQSVGQKDTLGVQILRIYCPCPHRAPTLGGGWLGRK